MQSIRLSHALMMGTSLAVVTLVAININALMPLLREPLALQTDADKKVEDPAMVFTPEPKVTKQKSTQKSTYDRVLADAEASSEMIPMEQAPAPAPLAKVSPGVVEMKNDGLASLPDQQPQYYHDQGRDKFTEIETNPVKVTTEEPVSTFSIDVDTASYAFIRGSLKQ